MSNPEFRTHKFVEIHRNDPKYKDLSQCSHGIIYAKTKLKSLNIYEKVAIVLMQMRFDGLIGFPGGGVDPGETAVEALNREIREELGWFEDEGPVKESNYLFTHFDEEHRLVLHFFAIEVSESKMHEIEYGSLKAHDYGDEVLGNFRVPLYTMKDSYRGLPAFLANKFVGNAKNQLLDSLVRLNLLHPDSVLKAISASNK